MRCDHPYVLRGTTTGTLASQNVLPGLTRKVSYRGPLSDAIVAGRPWRPCYFFAMQRVAATVKEGRLELEDDLELAEGAIVYVAPHGVAAIDPTPAEADELGRALDAADRAGPEDWLPAAAVHRR